MKNYLYLIIINIYWGFTTVFMKHALFFMNSSTYVGLRMLSGAIFCFIIFRKEWKSINKKSIIQGTILGFLLVMNLELTVWGLEYTSSTNCVFILQLSIIVVPLIECIRTKTKPKKELVFVIIGVMIGMIIMCSEKGFNINVGDLLIFISMLANSLFVIVTSEFVKTSSEGALSIIQLFSATVFGLILTFFTGFTIEVNTDSFMILIITGVIGSGIAYSMQLIAQKEVSTSIVSLTTTLQPVFGMIGATLIKDIYGNVEVISRMQLIGCIIILTSLVIYLVHQSRIINIRKKRLNF